MLNAMTVDVEDYFHVSAFAAHVDPADWDSFEARVEFNTRRLLDLFEEANVRATFFVLGWVAERHPGLVRLIASAGHELASHSYGHGLVYDTSPSAFRRDLERARQAIEQASGIAVCGYRAPSYSVTAESLWALDVLIEHGYSYDSSIYPIRHDRYGIPSWPRHVQLLQRATGQIWELPGSTVRHGGINLPVGGGGYFRLLPYNWTRYGMRRLNEVECQPAIFYVHPWEIDPAQPRIRASRLSTFRHYRNLDQTEARLRKLVKDFRFGTVSDVLAATRASATVSQRPTDDVVASDLMRSDVHDKDR